MPFAAGTPNADRAPDADDAPVPPRACDNVPDVMFDAEWLWELFAFPPSSESTSDSV
jgi:hypothetical protein